MIIVETKTPKKSQRQQGKLLNMPARHTGSSIAPAIRRLPSAYAMMHNISVNEIMQPEKREESISQDIYVKVNRVYKRIKAKDIYLVEGLCDYVNVYTKEKRYTIYSTMYGIMDKLPKSEFMRVHRSYIVRKDYISTLTNDFLSVEMRRIPVSKTYKSEVMAGLNILGR
jgi:DNA-binding LytR/AlgR family response regulator